MKVFVLMLILVSPVMAQDLSARTGAGCGPDDLKLM